jgi:hypothetical protein
MDALAASFVNIALRGELHAAYRGIESKTPFLHSVVVRGSLIII